MEADTKSLSCIAVSGSVVIAVSRLRGGVLVFMLMGFRFEGRWVVATPLIEDGVGSESVPADGDCATGW